MSNLPRILIVSGAPLNDTDGDSSTLCNMFWDYDPDKVAQVYFLTNNPNSKCCKKYFLISEISLLRKLFKWNTPVGQEVVMGNDSLQPTETQINTEMRLGSFVRSHRSKVFVYMRELLWGLGLWKNKDLRRFVEDFQPDVIWCESYPSRFIHNIGMYITKVSKKPSVVFLQDEVYQISPYMSRADKLYRLFIRGVIKDHIKQCQGHFVASPLMKEKYDNLFGIDSVFIAKSFDCNYLPPVSQSVHSPIRVVYLGNIVYGRLATLIEMAKALRIINSDSISIELSIYTTQFISADDKEFLLNTPGVKLPSPVPYDEVPHVISENDVLLFVESFELEHKYEASLSFSTKITDYLQSGSCIMAMGPSDIAPIRYFYDNDAALCLSDVGRIHEFLAENLNEKKVLEYAQKGRDCFIRNHNRSVMDKRIYEELARVAGVPK
jgi:glycosyltransferase involved in cell wall biosynthesis